MINRTDHQNIIFSPLGSIQGNNQLFSLLHNHQCAIAILLDSEKISLLDQIHSDLSPNLYSYQERGFDK
ncbi:hypothetical protein [Allocoleopsis sp.]|uniref:hypothetical protein n=1 Tax=Allocoleopsis sp. TaxID=3088169 RepID=UPI002FD06242